MARAPAATHPRRRTTARSVDWPVAPPVDGAEAMSACPQLRLAAGSGLRGRPADVLARASAGRLGVKQWEVVVRPDRAYFDMLEPEGMESPGRPYSGRIRSWVTTSASDGAARRRGSRRRSTFPATWRTPGSPSPRRAHAPARREVVPSRPGIHQRDVSQRRSRSPSPANQPVPLSDGDKVHVGAWTTVAVERSVLVEPGHGDGTAGRRRTRGTWPDGRKKVEIDLLGPLRLRVSGEEVPIGPPGTCRPGPPGPPCGNPVSAGDLVAHCGATSEPKPRLRRCRGRSSSSGSVLPEDTIETVQLRATASVCPGRHGHRRFERRCTRGRALLASGHPGAAVA